MTNDWKLILKVIIGSAALIMVIIFGLSKMSSGQVSTLNVDQNLLLDGAKLIKENGETKVTVVTFSDMECPACKRADGLMASLETTPGVKTVIRQYPLAIHKYALIMAMVVETAREMGKGFEMVDLLFSKQEEWSVSTNIQDMFLGYAKNLGLDEKIFMEKFSSSEVATTVQKDIDLGNSLKLSGTPTIYINGEPVAPDFAVAKVTELLKTK